MKIEKEYLKYFNFVRMYKQKLASTILFLDNQCIITCRLTIFPQIIHLYVYRHSLVLVSSFKISFTRKDFTSFILLASDRYDRRKMMFEKIVAECFYLNINSPNYDQRDNFIIYLEAADPDFKLYIKYNKVNEFVEVVKKFDYELWQEIMTLYVFDVQSNIAGNIMFWGDINTKLFRLVFGVV